MSVKVLKTNDTWYEMAWSSRQRSENCLSPVSPKRLREEARSREKRWSMGMDCFCHASCAGGRNGSRVLLCGIHKLASFRGEARSGCQRGTLSVGVWKNEKMKIEIENRL